MELWTNVFKHYRYASICLGNSFVVGWVRDTENKAQLRSTELCLSLAIGQFQEKYSRHMNESLVLILTRTQLKQFILSNVHFLPGTHFLKSYNYFCSYQIHFPAPRFWLTLIAARSEIIYCEQKAQKRHGELMCDLFFPQFLQKMNKWKI